MILSKAHKFVFVKGKKIAGTSVEVMLAEICGPDDIITPITPIDERQRLLKMHGRAAQNYGIHSDQHYEYLKTLAECPTEKLGEIEMPQGTYFNHMSLMQILAAYGAIPDSWTIFGVERCPYRKIISFANMQLRFKEYQISGTPMRSSPTALKIKIQELLDDGSIQNVKNIDMYRNGTGEMNAEILRYENLEAELKVLMARLNITGHPKLEHFKQGISSNNLDLREIFSKEQIEKINETFFDEFETFGYQMIE